MVRVHSDAPIIFPSVIPEFYHLLPVGIADLKCCVLAKRFPCIVHTSPHECEGRCEQVPDMSSAYSSGAHPGGTS
ncbi:hypothetical protein F3G22_02720 [Klebsiella pneumoniae]|nr:hypothetical protein F3G22_02720 [Klebsiella pneumoniae]